MDDSVFVWIVVLVVGGAIIGGIKGLAHVAQEGGQMLKQAARQKEQRRADVQTFMERRAVELLVEFPALDDAELAKLLHDELVNNRVTEAEFFRWANDATVGRMRRTLLVEAARQSRQG